MYNTMEPGSGIQCMPSGNLDALRWLPQSYKALTDSHFLHSCPQSGATSLTDEEILQLVKTKHIPAYKLEGAVGDPARGVAIRRKLISRQLISSSSLEHLPHTSYDYSHVLGTCCENVIGYMPIPEIGRAHV